MIYGNVDIAMMRKSLVILLNKMVQLHTHVEKSENDVSCHAQKSNSDGFYT